MNTATLEKNTTLTQPTSAQMTATTAKKCCTVSGIFENRAEAGKMLSQIIDLGVKRENISIIGRNLESETQITGFISRGDVIKDGIQSGAVFGALLGTVFSALSGFGVLFVPFVGAVVAGGPIGAALLGATSGAIAGSAGAGIVSALASLGLPKEKAALYETRIKEGGLMVTAEVDMEKSPEVERIFRESGGDEIHSCNDFILSRFDTGRVDSTSDLPNAIQERLSPEAQEAFVKTYNEVYAEEENEHVAAYRAWMSIENSFDQNDDGIWAIAK
ncbi:MAG: ChaB family protein [Limnothrix sp.]